MADGARDRQVGTGELISRGASRWGDTDSDLLTHLSTNHFAVLSTVAGMLPDESNDSIKLWSVYCEAIAWKIRQGAPLASYSIDRRAIANYAHALDADGIEELICFSCARRFPYIARASSHEIQWYKALSSTGVLETTSSCMQFCGLTPDQVEKIFGLEVLPRKSIAIGFHCHLNASL